MTTAAPVAPAVHAYVRKTDDGDAWLWSVVRGNELLADGSEPHEGDAWTHACGELERHAPQPPPTSHPT
jgi:hypothetical protein